MKLRTLLLTTSISAALVVGARPATAQNLLANGSFETGDFTGWGIKDMAAPFLTLGVRPAGTGPGFGFFLSDPTDGVFAATHGFDGAGPDTIELWQDVNIPAHAPAQLTLDWRAAWDFTLGATATRVRVLDVVIEPAGGGAPLQGATVLVADPKVAKVKPDTGPQTTSIDLSAFRGQKVRVKLVTTIPEAYTGPGHLQIDNVVLEGCSPLVVSAADASGPPKTETGQGLLGVFADFEPANKRIESFDDPSLTESPVAVWAAIVNQVNFDDIGNPDPLDLFVQTGKTGHPELGIQDIQVQDLIVGNAFLPSSDTFTATFTGCLNIRQAGCYRFLLGHDDGARLTIAGRRVIDFNHPTDFRVDAGTIEFLDPGLYPITVDLFESTSESDVVLWFVPPGADKPMVVPQELLFPCGAGPTGIDVQTTAKIEAPIVSGVIRIANVGDHTAIVTDLADSLEVHFAPKSRAISLPTGSSAQWFAVSEVRLGVTLPLFLPPGQIGEIAYSTTLCEGADFTGAKVMRNVAAVTVGNKPGEKQTVVSRSDGFLPSLGPGCPVVWGVQPASGYIVKIDPQTGTIFGTLKPPFPLGKGDLFAGLSIAEQGTTLLYLNAHDRYKDLYRLDPESGTILSVEYMPPAQVDPLFRAGLSFEEGPVPLIFGVNDGESIDRQDGFGGPVVPHLKNFIGFPGALGGDGWGRQFVYRMGEIQEFDPFAQGTVLGSFPAPTGAPLAGLAFDGRVVYASDLDGFLFQLDPDTGAILNQVRVPGGPLIALAARPW